MKKILLITGIILMVLSVMDLSAQKETESIKIQTSAQCDMCKERIENNLAYEKGVTSSELNMETMIVTIQYKPGKTNPETLREVISAMGYDADDVKANQKAYQKLPTCCKKPEDR